MKKICLVLFVALTSACWSTGKTPPPVNGDHPVCGITCGQGLHLTGNCTCVP